MARQLITFQLGAQSFGFDILAIREIRAWSPTTRLPHVPDYVTGVVNLRGTVLPVLDLAARLGWNSVSPTERHVIIVTEIDGQLRGLIVDSVSDIVTIVDEDIQPSTNNINETVARCLEGLVTIEERMVMVLDLSGLMSDVDDLKAA